MNKETNFANGFDYFCTQCGQFYSVSYGDCMIEKTWRSSEKNFINDAMFCPFCGEQDPYTSIEGILDFCDEYDIDPVIFYKIFPQDELIPQSCTGATPLQVSIILDLFAARRHKGLPVSVELIAGDNDIRKEVVRKVFEELHITEAIGVEG